MRVRLITEGNYPTHIGGVTRWCDLLLDGLCEHDWSVLALAVDSEVSRRRGIPISYPTQGTAAVRAVDSAVLTAIETLVRQLFAPAPDATAMLAGLVECRVLSASPSLLSHREVSESVVGWVEDILDVQPRGSGGASVDKALELVGEVLAACGVPACPVEVNLSACAGVAAIPAAIDRAVHSVPMVVVEHGIYVHEAYLRTSSDEIDWVERNLVRRCAANLAAVAYHSAAVVIGVSEANCTQSVRFGADPDRTVAIANGVEVSSRRLEPSADQVVGMVGRIDSFKGVDLFIEMAALLATRIPRARFVHIGPQEATQQEYASECTSALEASGLCHRFSFMGAHPDPPALLDGIDVFVQPSRSEGMPFSLLEAMAAGRAIVATGVGGVPEMLGDAGIVVPSEAPGDLAEAVETLLLEPGLAHRMGRRARTRAQERFGLEDMLSGYRSVLAMACDTHRVPA